MTENKDNEKEVISKPVHSIKKPNNELVFWKAATTILGILLIVSIFTDGFNPNLKNSSLQDTQILSAQGDNQAGNGESLAQCLTSKGVVMYGTEWCGHCQNQKKMFGEDVQYITFVDCDKESALCKEKGVTGYPTWIINGKSYPGEKPLDQLASLAGC